MGAGAPARGAARLRARGRAGLAARLRPHGPAASRGAVELPARPHGQPRTTPVARRLVVSSVDAPALLQLPRLPQWLPSQEAEPVPLQVLSGSDATPARVLADMRDATEIEIHAHGIMDPSLSDASLVVLSPETSGRYALTADVVRQQKLTGAPLVFLAACSAGRAASTTTSHEPFSLPAAFTRRRGRARCVASTVDIPDAAG
ncbi:CHAT domain-containing protein, partial [Myxococcus sp. 1LA]